MAEQTPRGWSTRWVGGVPVHPIELPRAADVVIDLVRTGRAHRVHPCSANDIAHSHRDKDYRTLLCEATLNLPDGMPLALLSRERGARLTHRNRPRGTDVMRAVLAASQGDRLVSHYFFGGTDESLARLLSYVRTEFPGATIAGHHAPEFASVTEAFIESHVGQIQASEPSLVWVGLGAPKQAQFGALASARFPATYVMVGAAFDFLGGLRREAPRLWQRSGLEWLYRWRQEPQRLTRRYTIGAVQFVAAVAAERNAGAKGRRA